MDIDLGLVVLSALASFAACFFATLSGGGAGLILLPVLMLTGMPFTNALASNKMAVAFIGFGSGVRFEDTAPHPDIGTAVGTDGVKHGSRENDRRQGRIGTAVENHLDVERLQPALRIEASLSMYHRWMPTRRLWWSQRCRRRRRSVQSRRQQSHLR